LSAPALNVTTYDWFKPTLYDPNTGRTFTYDYVQANGICQDISENKYQWGFSFLILFIFLCLLLIWTTGTCIIWLKSRGVVKHRQTEADIGTYTGILELSKAITHNFESISQDPGKLKEHQIHATISRKLKGGTVPFDLPLQAVQHHQLPELNVSSKGYQVYFKSWTTWWIILLVLLSAMIAPTSMFQKQGGLVFFSFTSSGVLMALFFGSTEHSRCLVFLIFFVLGSGAGILAHVI
jgi:hypothetical protein